MPSVLLWAYSAEELFLISQIWKICGFSRFAFSREGFGTNSLSQNLTVLPAPSGREPLAWRESLRLNRKACGCACSPGGAVAQRLRGCKSAEPEKTVKRSSRRTGVNLQFFPVQPSSLGLKGASSPFFVAPARRNRWHFSGSLLVSKENISALISPHRTARTPVR